MNHRNPGYLSNVDELVSSARPHLVLSHYGLPSPENSSGEYRLPCVFNSSCADSSYGSLTINLSDPASALYCHACATRGNILTLLFGLEHGRPPTGGKLRGDEFKETVTRLREVLRTPECNEVTSQPARTSHPALEPVNVPLRRQQRTRSLVNLWQQLECDVANMSDEAASWFRRRPWLTPALCREWRLGYLARSARSLLRGLIVYTHRDEAGEIITYSGRDPAYERKLQAWKAQGRTVKSKPMKHRYVKGFCKGIQLYGEHASRLQSPAVRESLQKYGLVIVEGQSDCIRLSALGVAAVALTSNRASEHQVTKLIRYASAVANGHVLLMPDNDHEGESGFRELMWALASARLNVRLGWSAESHEGRFAGRQPESLTADEWLEVSGG